MVKKISISLPENLYREAKEFSEETGATFSGFVKLSLKEKLAKNERRE